MALKIVFQIRGGKLFVICSGIILSQLVQTTSSSQLHVLKDLFVSFLSCLLHTGGHLSLRKDQRGNFGTGWEVVIH